MKENIDLVDEEKLILFSLGALDNTPLRSKIKIHKLLFLVSNVFKNFQDLFEFEPHLFGPYSETLNYLLEDLQTIGYVQIQGSEYKLTPKGYEVYRKLKPNEQLNKVLNDFKEFLNDLSDDEILTFVYVSYPKYIGESAKWDQLKKKREQVAISLLKKGKISFGKAVEISGLNVSKFEDLLKRFQVKWKYDY
jgi:predicted HTH domain antitoxin